jgi:hypothetical protein
MHFVKFSRKNVVIKCYPDNMIRYHDNMMLLGKHVSVIMKTLS